MLVYVNVFATYAHTYISKYIVLDALVSTYVPTHLHTYCMCRYSSYSIALFQSGIQEQKIPSIAWFLCKTYNYKLFLYSIRKTFFMLRGLLVFSSVS